VRLVKKKEEERRAEDFSAMPPMRRSYSGTLLMGVRLVKNKTRGEQRTSVESRLSAMAIQWHTKDVR
jgi:hypothetical protein